jgi:hypothetical protein
MTGPRASTRSVCRAALKLAVFLFSMKMYFKKYLKKISHVLTRFSIQICSKNIFLTLGFNYEINFLEENRSV